MTGAGEKDGDDDEGELREVGKLTSWLCLWLGLKAQ